MESRSPRRALSRSSLYVPVAGNLVPLAGAAVLGWSPGEIMFLYWIEVFVVGAFNLGRMATADVGVSGGKGALGKAFPMAFFGFIFGSFYFMYGSLLLTAFPEDWTTLAVEAAWKHPTDGLFTQMLFFFSGVAPVAIAWQDPSLRVAIVALVVTHAFAFARDYGRYEEFGNALLRPLGRLWLFFTIAFIGAFTAQAFGSPVAPLIALVLVKILVEASVYQRQHERGSVRTAVGAGAVEGLDTTSGRCRCNLFVRCPWNCAEPARP